METVKERRLRVRRRLKRDFPYYAKNALKIRTKEGDVIPFELNEAQRHLQSAIDKELEERGFVRLIILKGRQQGLSTNVGGWMYFKVSQRKGAKAMVVAHKADSTSTLFDMTKRYHTNCPDALKPSTKYSSKRELVFDALDSSYTVATAGGEDIGRSETIQYLHASEVAFWPASTQEAIWNGLENAVPDVKDTAVFIESTANGMTGVFKELWDGAVKGDNDYVPVFIPWYWEPAYRAPVPPGFHRTPDEEELCSLYGLDDQQLAWRRLRIASTSLDKFKQEYPCNPDEAFLTSGSPVFNPEQLSNMLKAAPDHPLRREELLGEAWGENPRGALSIYVEYDKNEVYTIGGDVGAGIRGADYSVATVLDSKKRVVAVYRAHVLPDYFGHVLNSLGKRYNTARLCVESNNHGILTLHVLAKELFYPNLYTEVQHDKQTDKETVKLGFSTTVKTKPLIIDSLRKALREGLKVYDRVTLKELMRFILTESGKMEAEAGCFDDCVIALALANYVHVGAAPVIENLDEWYEEGI